MKAVRIDHHNVTRLFDIDKPISDLFEPTPEGEYTNSFVISMPEDDHKEFMRSRINKVTQRHKDVQITTK
jgi:hypothetical protein